jgi:hypothetical protein
MRHVSWGLVALCGLMTACSARSGGSSKNSLGARCTIEDHTSNKKVCSGTSVLECYSVTDEKATTDLTWNFDKDCKENGMVCVSGACTDGPSANDDAGVGGGGSDAAGPISTDCPNLAGTWSIREHCDPGQVDKTLVVTQSGCSFSFSGAGLTSVSGTISGSDTVTVTGTSSAGPTSCTGTIDMKLSGSAIDQLDLICEPTCSISVKPVE